MSGAGAAEGTGEAGAMGESVLCGTWESSRFSRLSSGLRRVRDAWELRETRHSRLCIDRTIR